MSIIQVSKLTKRYDDFVAVDGVDFKIDDGEIFGFLGPNGAGKTSTINMLTGLAKMTAGSAYIAGVDCNKDMKKVQQMIGIVPDESNLYGEMSGFDNLCFCASLYGIKKKEREKRAKELLEQFGLTNTGLKPFKAYSKGMKRKLTIAAGIIHAPKILFLDEPTTGIDVESARYIRKLVLDLNQKGTTIFLTTHYLEEAERLCDRIAFIVDGKIVHIGKVDALMQEAQQKHMMQFTIDKDAEKHKAFLEKRFVDYHIKAKNDTTITISSLPMTTLMPIMQCLEETGSTVYEAKRIKPSLEEVFVKITQTASVKTDTRKGGEAS